MRKSTINDNNNDFDEDDDQDKENRFKIEELKSLIEKLLEENYSLPKNKDDEINDLNNKIESLEKKIKFLKERFIKEKYIIIDSTQTIDRLRKERNKLIKEKGNLEKESKEINSLYFIIKNSILKLRDGITKKELIDLLINDLNEKTDENYYQYVKNIEIAKLSLELISLKKLLEKKEKGNKMTNGTNNDSTNEKTELQTQLHISEVTAKISGAEENQQVEQTETEGSTSKSQSTVSQNLTSSILTQEPVHTSPEAPRKPESKNDDANTPPNLVTSSEEQKLTKDGDLTSSSDSSQVQQNPDPSKSQAGFPPLPDSSSIPVPPPLPPKSKLDSSELPLNNDNDQGIKVQITSNNNEKDKSKEDFFKNLKSIFVKARGDQCIIIKKSPTSIDEQAMKKVTASLLQDIQKLINDKDLHNTVCNDKDKERTYSLNGQKLVTQTFNDNSQLNFTFETNPKKFTGVISVQRIDDKGKISTDKDQCDVIYYVDGKPVEIIMASPLPSEKNCRIYDIAKNFYGQDINKIYSTVKSNEMRSEVDEYVEKQPGEHVQRELDKQKNNQSCGMSI